MGSCSSISVAHRTNSPVKESELEEVLDPDIPHSLLCGVCFNLLCISTSFNCGHTLCWKCAHRWVGDDKTKGCPECRKPVGDFRRCIALDHMARDIASKWPVDSERRLQWERSVAEGLTISVAYETAQNQSHIEAQTITARSAPPVRQLRRQAAFNEARIMERTTESSDTESSSSEEEDVFDEDARSVDMLPVETALISLIHQRDSLHNEESSNSSDSESSSDDETAEHHTDQEESERAETETRTETTSETTDSIHGDDGRGPWPTESDMPPNCRVKFNFQIYGENQMCEVVRGDVSPSPLPPPPPPDPEISITSAATSAATIASLAATYALSAATSAAVLSGAVSSTSSSPVCLTCGQSFKTGCVRGMKEDTVNKTTNEWVHMRCMDLPTICLEVAKHHRQVDKETVNEEGMDVVLEVHIDLEETRDHLEYNHKMKETLATEVKASLSILGEADWLMLKLTGSLWQDDEEK